jgi:hypothetical protein
LLKVHLIQPFVPLISKKYEKNENATAFANEAMGSLAFYFINPYDPCNYFYASTDMGYRQWICR